MNLINFSIFLKGNLLNINFCKLGPLLLPLYTSPIVIIEIIYIIACFASKLYVDFILVSYI